MRELPRLVIAALDDCQKPVSARYLSQYLSEEDRGLELSKSEINSILYSREVADYVRKVDQRNWIVVKRPSTPRKRRATVPIPNLDLAERSIYIDFEGTMVDPPSLLGVLLPDGDFTQYVFDKTLYPASAAKAKGSVNGFHCVTADPREIIRNLVARAEQDDVLLIAWAQRERHAVRDYKLGSDLTSAFELRYFDGRRIARRWHSSMRPELSWKVPQDLTKYSLAALAPVFEYEIPKAFGAGNTAQRIRYVRDQLASKNGDWKRLTAVAKAKWTKMLKHNFHDCYGMRHIVLSCASELESS